MKYCEQPNLTDLGNSLSGVVADTFVNVNIELYTTKPASSDRRLIKTLDQQINDTTFIVESAVVGSCTEYPQLLSPPTDRLRSKSSLRSLTEAANESAKKASSASATPSASAGSGSSNATAVSNLTTGLASLNTAPFSAAHFGGLTSSSGGVSGGVSKRRAQSTPASTTPAGLFGSPFGPLAEVGNMKQYAYLISVLNASDPDRDFSALQPSSFRRIYTDLANPLQQAIVGLGVRPPPSMWNMLDDEITFSECKAYSLELPQQFLEDDDSGISWSKMFFFFNKRRKRVLFVNLNSRPASYHRDSSSDSEGVLGEME